MHWLTFLAIAACLYGALNWWTTERAVPHPPGVLVTAEPVQENLEPPRAFDHKGYRLAARARYDISACVLRREVYRIDGGAGLAPVDLGVGWGVMSDSKVVERLKFSQMGRFLYWDLPDGTYPIAPLDIITHSAQMHMIPSEPQIESQLKRLRPGQLVHVVGWLVDVRGPHGFQWNTSMRRDDTGDGACEIVYVERLDLM
jgi:hypothetical protein